MKEKYIPKIPIQIYGVANDINIDEIRHMIQKEKSENNPLLENIAVNEPRPIRIINHIPRIPKNGMKIRIK